MYLSDTAHPADRTVAASDRPRIADNVIHRSPAPSLYLLNAAALSKPHAVDQLGADLRGYDVDVAVITETHFKSKHTDSVVSVPGIQCYVEIGIVREEAASHYMYDPLCRSLSGLSPGTIVRSRYCGAVLTSHLSVHCITLHALPTMWSLFCTTLNNAW